VWKCFLFILFSVTEFAFANFILTTKQWNTRIAYSVDDFCQWTIAPTWLLSNLRYWPIINNTAGIVFIALIEVAYFCINIYRVYWNYQNGSRDMAVHVKRLIHNSVLWYHRHVSHTSNDTILIGWR